MYTQNKYVNRKVYLNVEQPKIDERLGFVNIPKGLVESLNNAGFTIEMILNSKPADIAEILGIDDYVAQIIYQESKYYYHMNQ
ncbi:MAG: hypothetical protein QOK90_08670 [Nitrososphaeraceae archaeon]|jgi:hypothetical protein|nr:hypothetical protein [Nitrososphaeraceae archaeon]HEX2407321.1 hypothetical protein [Nitrososphaeraceae archaeon]